MSLVPTYKPQQYIDVQATQSASVLAKPAIYLPAGQVIVYFVDQGLLIQAQLLCAFPVALKSPLTFIFPTTSNFTVGELVPIPTFPFELTLTAPVEPL